MTLTCHCGALSVTTLKRPDYVNECNCSLCRKAGAQWAYFHPDEVSFEGSPSGYSRTDKDDPAAEVRFCATCGSVTHFVLTPSAVEKFGNTLMGLNMRLVPEADLAGIELRYPDGAAWTGAGEFTYRLPPRTLGA